MSATWNAGTCGGPVRRPLQAENAGARQIIEVVPRAERERAVLPVSGQRAHDEARVSRPQHGVPEAQPIEHARAELLEQDVRAIDEAQHGVLRALLLQVEARASLVAIESEKDSRGVPRERRREAQIIAAARFLDLVDACAEIGQDERSKRPRQKPREIEDANALERPGHL
jgi:hypothetical protein